MTSPFLLLLQRRRHRKSAEMADSSDGLLDVLSNVVGVMALVGSLTGVFAATSTLNIQAPMQTKADRNFWTLQVSSEGVWDLQPAIQRMTQLDRERVDEVRLCDQLLPAEKIICEKRLDGWAREEQLGSIGMNLSHDQGSLKRNGPPTVSAELLQEPGGWLDQLIVKLARERKAVFVVLESDGFELYRVIKSKAIFYKVPIGWEPWYKGDPINFWGNSGRSMMVQ